MTRVDEFDAFYASTQRATLATTYAACGDRQVARDATAAAYEHAWRQWARIGTSDPAGFVRGEAWKATVVDRGTHPLRRRRERGTDGRLLGALADLEPDPRRLIVLMTLADLDLDVAAREVGVDDEIALELASRGFGRLEETFGTTIDGVVARMRDLAASVGSVDLPRAAEVRGAAMRGARRNTVLLIALAVLVTLLGGALVADGGATARQEALPDREKIGAESRDIVLDSHNISTDDLLTPTVVSALNPDATWTVEATDTDPANATPYATCPTTRFADPNPLKVFVRASGSDAGDRVAQSIEVSRSQAASEQAFQRLVSFYAECEHPRTRLVDAFRVQRPFGDFEILRLQSYRSPARFITVGLAQSGALTTTLVHESPGTRRTGVRAFAAVLNESVGRVCADSGGDCTTEFDVVPTEPPPASAHPQFLGVVDLPPVDAIDSVWSASEPLAVTDQNPASTSCDEATFTGEDFVDATARVFAIPEATVLPEQFALTQATARMTSERAVADFVTRLSKRVDACPDGDLPTTVDQKTKIVGDGFRGNSWRIGYEVDKDEVVHYRMGIVRRGDAVTQVLFPPAGRYELSAKEFNAVLHRAGERLAYAGRSSSARPHRPLG